MRMMEATTTEHESIVLVLSVLVITAYDREHHVDEADFAHAYEPHDNDGKHHHEHSVDSDIDGYNDGCASMHVHDSSGMARCTHQPLL